MGDHRDISAEFPFESKRVEVLGSHMHYIDEGTGDPILFLHGQPTSSYLWRNIVPHMSSLGRCIAPDLIGFGKSDKPDIEYRFVDHVAYVEEFIQALGLRNITLVIHDWGSGLGFHYAMRHQHNVKGIAFMEAISMPIPSFDGWSDELREIFQAFRTPDVGWDLIVNKNMFVEQILPQNCFRKLSEREMDVYREPFRDHAHRKPVWRWPNELPIAGEPSDVAAIVDSYNQKLPASDLPKLLLYATPGVLITAEVVEWCRQNLKNLSTADVGQGIHFLQEDNPHQIGEEIANWYKTL
jgi:haloalkane dehalogenase